MFEDTASGMLIHMSSLVRQRDIRYAAQGGHDTTPTDAFVYPWKLSHQMALIWSEKGNMGEVRGLTCGSVLQALMSTNSGNRAAVPRRTPGRRPGS